MLCAYMSENISPHHQVAVVCIRHSKRETIPVFFFFRIAFSDTILVNKAASDREYVRWGVANGTGEEAEREARRGHTEPMKS